MIRTFAQIICIIFHPLLMATVMFLFIAVFSPEIIGPTSLEFLRIFLLIIFVLTFIIPLISISMLKMTGAIHSFHMPTREERILPFILITLYYGVSTYLLIDKLSVNDVIAIMLYTITAQIFLLAIITFFWKISAHALSVGGVLGFLCALNLQLPDNELFFPIVFMACLSGLVMSARLYLNSHNPPQVYSGAFIGFILSFSTILIFG